MGAPQLNAVVVVLDRIESGDSWRRLITFSGDHGRLECMHRVSTRRAATTPLPDLFDELSVALETRNQGRTWFIRETELVRRRTGLGASYEALHYACLFARLLARNPLHDESTTAVNALLRRALDAWETGIRPDAVYFKSIYLLARDEGFPVRQEWWRQLGKADRDLADAILRAPASEQTTMPADTKRLTSALEQYLSQTSDFRFEA